jgi:hypothetical protein
MGRRVETEWGSLRVITGGDNLNDNSETCVMRPNKS